jgi:hypothetical protein
MVKKKGRRKFEFSMRVDVEDWNEARKEERE